MAHGGVLRGLCVWVAILKMETPYEAPRPLVAHAGFASTWRLPRLWKVDSPIGERPAYRHKTPRLCMEDRLLLRDRLRV